MGAALTVATRVFAVSATGVGARELDLSSVELVGIAALTAGAVTYAIDALQRRWRPKSEAGESSEPVLEGTE